MALPLRSDEEGALARDAVVGRFRKFPGVEVGVAYITPDVAEEWLYGNVRNRKLRPSWLIQLSGAVGRGEFVLNGESIIFSQTGVLLDGQFRLNAVIQSATPIWSVVVWGVPDVAQATIDQNPARSAGDVLHFLRNAPQSGDVAAVLTQLWLYENRGVLGADAPHRPTRTQIVEMYDRTTDLSESLTVGTRIGPLFGARGVVGAIHHLLSSIDADMAAEFFDRLQNGEGLQKGHPIHTLRETLLRDAASKQSRMPIRRRAAIVIRAWNAWRDNEQLTKFQWVSTDNEFPKAH